ncbi:MAG: class I SAM-dependent methyltransferase [Chitinophagaceae bacterium]
MNIDNFEKKYYESSRFWEPGALEDTANLERIRITADMVPQDVTSLVDAGCGNGIFLNRLLSERPNIISCGFDRSEEALKHVKVKKFIGAINDIHLDNKSFDCVSCLEVIEHIPLNLYPITLNELSRLSKKYLLISVPYDEDLLEDSTQCPACKSIFNSNLHLRSYSTEVFSNLFNNYGFYCKNYILAGPRKGFKLHKEYRSIFYRSQFLQWLSPICPICGFEQEEKATNSQQSISQQKSGPSIRSFITGIPKLIWPKEIKYYWIIGLFERIEFKTNIKS